MNIPIIFHFLNEIQEHNNREWFHANKPLYDEVRKNFEDFLAQIIARISTFDDSVNDLFPSDCTFRISRDTRFGEDKTPYKLHMGGYMNGKGRKSDYFGYYIHLQPGRSMLGGGSYCISSKSLKAFRTAIMENIDEYISIVEDPEFKRFFPFVGEDFVRTYPKGFPKDFPYIDYLRCKRYTCTYPVDDDFFTRPDFLDRLEEVFRQMKRVADFFNSTLDNLED